MDRRNNGKFPCLSSVLDETIRLHLHNSRSRVSTVVGPVERVVAAYKSSCMSFLRKRVKSVQRGQFSLQKLSPDALSIYHFALIFFFFLSTELLHYLFKIHIFRQLTIRF